MDLAVATGLNKLPMHLRLQVKWWVTDGVATPKLRSMLEEQRSLLAPFLRDHAPHECYGSRHKVLEWQELGGEHGRQRLAQATDELYERFCARMICAHQYHRRLSLVRGRELLITRFRQVKIRFRLWARGYR